MSDSEPREGVGNCEKRFAHAASVRSGRCYGAVDMYLGGLAGSWVVAPVI